MIDVLLPASGKPFVDLIFTGLPKLPDPGEEVYARDLTIVPGGAMTAALVLHRLGLRVVFEATLGRDFGSRFLLDIMEEEGLPRDGVNIRDEVRANITVAYNIQGDRSFLSYLGGDIPPDPALVERFPSRCVLLAGLRPGERLTAALRIARANRSLIVADTQEQPLTLQDEPLRELIASLDVLLCNEREARFVSGQADIDRAVEVLAALAPTLVVKRGARGASAYWAYGPTHLDALPVEPVDLTGCGDNFTAAFTAALVDGQSLPTCLAWGNAAGAIAAQHPGGTSARISRERIIESAQRHYGDKLLPDPLRNVTLEEHQK